MQDNNYKNAFAGVGKMLAEFGITDDFIKQNAHNFDPSMMVKYNEQMGEVNVQKAKLNKLEDDLKNMNI